MRRATLLLVGLALLVGCRTTAIPPPTTIVVSTGMDAAEVRAAVVSALMPDNSGGSVDIGIGSAEWREGRPWWRPEGERAATITASYKQNEYYLKVDITYSAQAVTIRLLSSRNLLQSDTRIHATALRWLAELEDAIRVSLGYAAVLRP